MSWVSSYTWNLSEGRKCSFFRKVLRSTKWITLIANQFGSKPITLHINVISKWLLFVSYTTYYQWFNTKILIIQEQPSERCSVKKSFLEISQNSQENACVRDSFIIKLQACNFIKKESLAQVFSCEFCEISKNSFFIEYFWTTASDN